MTLSAATATIYPWSTSSWSLRCENMGGSALPFSSLALSGNYFGARLLAKLENVIGVRLWRMMHG